MEGFLMARVACLKVFKFWNKLLNYSVRKLLVFKILKFSDYLNSFIRKNVPWN